jgi:hypothetical protein
MEGGTEKKGLQVGTAPVAAGGWWVLPHEWAFGGFLLLMALRLALQAGLDDRHTLEFLAYFLGCVAVLIWAEHRPTPVRWRVRLLWYPAVMGLAFYSMAGAVHTLGIADADALLAGWDLTLLGRPASEYFAAIQTPLATDLMVLAYLFFFYYLIMGPAHYCLHDLRRFRSCFAGLFTLYALGFLGYTLLPAGGPRLTDATAPLIGGTIARWMLPLINAGSNGVDVFPSIHVAASLYLLAFDFRHHRPRFWRLLLPCLALWISTVYLRYHYVVDLLGSLVITAAGLATTWLYERSRLAQAIERQAALALAATPDQTPTATPS